MAPKAVPAEIRFWRFVNKNGPFCEHLGSRCWLWTGAKSTTPSGEQYGRFRGPDSVMVSVARFSWSMKFGPADAEAMDHLCRVTLCVNPDHAEPVTDKVNILRGLGEAAANARKMRCPRKHQYDRTSGGRRYCSKCRDRGTCPAGHPYNAVSKDGKRYCTTCKSANGQQAMASRWGQM